MRIVFDLQAAQSPGSRIRGIGRYSLSLAEALARNAGSHDVWIALNHGFPDVVASLRDRLCRYLPEERIVVWETLHGTAAIDPANAVAARAAEGLREQFLRQLAPDVIHTSSLFEGLTDDVVSVVPRTRASLRTVSLYDLIPYVRQDVYLQDPRARNWYLAKVRSMLDADLLLGISDYTCREAIEHLEIAADRVVNISAGVGDEFFVLGAQERERAKRRLHERFGLAERFVIYTGGFDARKNLERLVRAFGAVDARAREGIQLVIAGHGPAVLVDRLREVAGEAGLEARDVLFTDYVDDADLRALYNLCTLHVFPSLHEGFGLPALEAMACGAPVIGANATSLPEVIGLEAAMFDPLSTDDMACHIEKAIVDDAFRQQLRDHAAVQLRKFSWDDTARRALAAMERGAAALGRERRLATPATPELAPLAEELCQAIPDDDAFHRLRQPLARALALNALPARRQLLVDVTVLSVMDIGTGIQRVVRNIARCLLARQHADYDVCLVRFEHGLGYVEANALTRRLGGDASEGPDRPVAVYPNDVLLGLDLISHVVPVERAYFEWLRRRGVQVWFVVYDMLPVRFPHYFREEVKAPFVPWYAAIGELASGLLCISRAVACEVRDWFDRTQPRRGRPLPLAHFHLGADLDSTAAAPVARRNGGGEGVTFLMVGTVEPRKGHALVLDAMERLWAQGEDMRLVVVGKPGWLSDDVIARLRMLAPGGRVTWHEAADDALLRESYARADALIMASEGEGFGLPLIEAAQHGVPLIARDLPVFREIAGEAAFYFSGNDPQALAGRLQEWAAAHAAGAHPDPDALEWLTWEQSTSQLLDAIRDPARFQAWVPEACHVAGPADAGHIARAGAAIDNKRNHRDSLDA